MPITFEIDSDHKAVFVTGTGNLTKAAISGYLKELFQDPAFDPTFCHLIDYSEISEIEVDTNDLVEIVEATKSSDPRKGKIAVVIGDNLGRSFLADFYVEFSRLAKGQEMRSFETADAAKAWLELP